MGNLFKAVKAKIKRKFDHVFGETRTETITRLENGNRIVIINQYKGNVLVYSQETKYYPGFSINI